MATSRNVAFRFHSDLFTNNSKELVRMLYVRRKAEIETLYAKDLALETDPGDSDCTELYMHPLLRYLGFKLHPLIDTMIPSF